MFHPSRLPPMLACESSGDCIPIHKPWAKATEAAAKSYAEEAGCDIKTMSPARMRLMLALGFMQEQRAAETSIRRTPTSFSFGGPTMGRENTTEADIASWATQQIAYVKELAEAWVIPEIVTVIPMTGPTAYVHREHAERSNSDAAYESGSALLEGNDPSYSDCPAACGAANAVELSIDSDVVEYICKRLTAKYCYPANFAVSSQYNFSLDSRLNELMRDKLLRDLQKEIIDDMVANAGDVILWNATPTVGSYYASTDPKTWQATLYDKIVQADGQIVADPQGRAGGATQLLADLETVERLRKLAPFRIRADYTGGTTQASIDAMQANFGIEQAGRYPVVRVPTMADNTVLVQLKNDRDPTYVYNPWVVLHSLGMTLDPETGEVKLGLMHLYGKKAIRPGRMREIRITPEA